MIATRRYDAVMSAPEDDPHIEDTGELRALGTVMQHSPLLRTLVDLIEGLVLIVGPDRRVVAASDRAVAALGAASERASKTVSVPPGSPRRSR